MSLDLQQRLLPLSITKPVASWMLQVFYLMDDETGLPVISRLGFAADASDFIQIASTLGIEISERTAHRILAGSIAPLRSVSARLLRERATPGERSMRQVDLERDRRGLKISKDDIASFSSR